MAIIKDELNKTFKLMPIELQKYNWGKLYREILEQEGKNIFNGYYRFLKERNFNKLDRLAISYAIKKLGSIILYRFKRRERNYNELAIRLNTRHFHVEKHLEK